MKILFAVLSIFLGIFAQAKEKIFVVERESNSIAVIENGLPSGRMENMHNMNHGIIKFFQNDGYVISRDGYIVRFDPKSEKKLSEYKTSKSAIWFVIAPTYVLVIAHVLQLA
jgi:protein NirF